MRLWNITLEKAVVVPKSEKDCETFMFQLFSYWCDWLHSCFWVCKSLQGIFQKPCCHSLRKLKLGRWSLFPTVCGSFIAAETRVTHMNIMDCFSGVTSTQPWAPPLSDPEGSARCSRWPVRPRFKLVLNSFTLTCCQQRSSSVLVHFNGDNLQLSVKIR